MEACVIVLDIGRSTSAVASGSQNNQTFFERAKACVSKIIQRKIFSKPRDEIGLVLMGTAETDNRLHTNSGGYDHISEAFSLTTGNWQMLRILERLVLRTDVEASWFDALVVAMDFLREGAVGKKLARMKIIFVSPLMAAANVTEQDVTTAVNGLSTIGCELNVINDAVEYDEASTDDIFDGVGTFSQQQTKSAEQKLNETLISDIVTQSEGALCNIDSAELLLVYFDRKATKAMPWNSELSIGSQIKFSISAFLLITAEKGLPSFKTESNDPRVKVERSSQFFKNDTLFKPDKAELIKGFMYGTTVVPFDTEINITYKSGEQRLDCLGFTSFDNILEEYLCGNGTHVVVARRGCKGSEEKLSALVEAMIEQNVVMIATKVYRRDTRPKLHALVPTYKQKYPCLVMLELIFQEEAALLRFPKLCSNKHKPSEDQYNAIDKLMDSMNLMDALDQSSGTKEAFAPKKTLNPVFEHVYRTVVHRALNPRVTLPPMDPALKELVEVPSKIRDRSSDALEEVKNAFPLKEVKVNLKNQWLQKVAKIGVSGDDGTAIGNGDEAEQEDDSYDDYRTLVEIGTVTPAEDFALLLARGEKFATLATQMQNVISDLVFKSMTIQQDKVIMALMMYRGEAQKIGPYRYNEWIVEFKKSLLGRNKGEFWEEVVVKERLGLITTQESEMTTITDEEAEEFYQSTLTAKGKGDSANDDYVDADDLFDEM